MAFPNKATQFKPGQSGNPTGKRKRPDVDTLNRLIDEKKLGESIIATWLKLALGDVKTGRKPDPAFFRMLLEYRNGSPPKELANDVDANPDDKPRIVIPGSPGGPSGPEAPRSPRKRKPST